MKTGVIRIFVTTIATLVLVQPLSDNCPLVCTEEPKFSIAPFAGSRLTPQSKEEIDNHEETGSNYENSSRSLALIPRVLVLGYYPNYVADHFPVNHIRYDKLTHISYFSLLPSANGNLNTSEINFTDLEELVVHADANEVKKLITVGGSGRSEYFATIAAHPRARANFAKQLLQFCLDYNLDGADLDWEPISTSRDRTNFSLLIERVHEEFEPFGLSLSISVSAYGHEITREAIDFVDWLNVMAYDGTPPNHSTFDFAISALDHWEDYGAPREKLTLGLPFYGKTEDDIGYAYKDIFEAYRPGPDTDFINGIGFNGVNTIKDKTAYTVNNGYRGIMFWEISQDTTNRSSLLTAATDTIMNFQPSDFDRNRYSGSNNIHISALVWQISTDNDNCNSFSDIFRSLNSFVDGQDFAAFFKDWLTIRKTAFLFYLVRIGIFINNNSNANQQTYQ